jgi:DNA-binding response OmpR family regulator
MSDDRRTSPYTEATMTSEKRLSSSAVRIAVIDNDSGFLQVLANRLDRVGWAHRTLESSAPVDDLRAMRLTAVVIDPSIFGAAGETYLERICTELPGLAVIVCTAQSTVAQRVRGLRLGADDWLTKPCHPEELIARIEAVTRRRRRVAPDVEVEAVAAGPLEIRADQFQAFVDGRSIELTRREFELLQLLSAAGGRVLEREEIYQQVWGYAMAHGDRSVDVFVRKLRQKLEKASPHWRYIHTHFGVGYRFAAEATDMADVPSAAPAASPAPEADVLGASSLVGV